MKKYLLALFIILALPTLCFAGTPHYVDATSGSDSNTGLSHAQAWQTLSKVNSYPSFATGDDVYLLCGETWSNERITVDWTGTSGDTVVIGAYHYDSGEVHTVSGNKPIIQGTIDGTDYGNPPLNYALVEVRNGDD